MHRKPVVAGIFYQDNVLTLRNQIEKLFLNPLGPGELPEFPQQTLLKSFGLILPHAGYVYSGSVAAWGIREAAKKGKPETVVLLGPCHTGMGKPVSVWDRGAWETPFGNIEIDTELATQLLARYEYASPNYEAHFGEHSLEVNLPLLQFIYGRDFKILPIAMMDQRKSTAKELGAHFAFLKNYKPILFIASTDLNHYESEALTRSKDQEVLDAILQQNVDHLYSALTDKNISMCGFGPVAALLSADMGTPILLKHATSGEVSGDFHHVVGYASVVMG